MELVIEVNQLTKLYGDPKAVDRIDFQIKRGQFFGLLGMVVAAAARDMPTANISLTAMRLPMIFIGGVFIPVHTLPVELQVISYLTPLTYVVDALREATVRPSMMFVIDLVALLAWMLVSQALAIIALNRKKSRY